MGKSEYLNPPLHPPKAFYEQFQNNPRPPFCAFSFITIFHSREMHYEAPPFFFVLPRIRGGEKERRERLSRVDNRKQEDGRNSCREKWAVTRINLDLCKNPALAASYQHVLGRGSGLTPGGALEQQIRVVPLLHLSALHLSNRQARKADRQTGRRECGLLRASNKEAAQKTTCDCHSVQCVRRSQRERMESGTR